MLNPLQIGLLSKHIKTSIENNPIDDNITKGVSQGFEPWEQELSDLIIKDKCLPSYDYMQNNESELLEFLIEYFTPEQK